MMRRQEQKLNAVMSGDKRVAREGTWQNEQEGIVTGTSSRWTGTYFVDHEDGPRLDATTHHRCVKWKKNVRGREQISLLSQVVQA